MWRRYIAIGLFVAFAIVVPVVVMAQAPSGLRFAVTNAARNRTRSRNVHSTEAIK